MRLTAMRLKDTPMRLRSLLPTHRREPPGQRTGAGRPSGYATEDGVRTGTLFAETFCAQTLPHLDAIYSDACCLTGRQEAAADLVVEAYLRAFREAERAGGECPPARLRPRGMRAWLLRNLHAAFCGKALALMADPQTPTGERP